MIKSSPPDKVASISRKDGDIDILIVRGNSTQVITITPTQAAELISNLATSLTVLALRGES